MKKRAATRVKRLSLLMVATLVLAAVVSSLAQAAPAPQQGPIRVSIDEAALTLEVAPQMVGGRVMVPYRAIAERLGARVGWDSRTRVVTVTKGADVMRLTVGQTTATVRGRNVTLDTAPMVVAGRVMVPLRFLGEGLGARVDWDGSRRIVSVRTPRPAGQAQLPQGPPIRIGVAGPMAFIAGEHMWHGAVMAQEDINRAGGITVGNVRRPIQLIRVDTNEILSVPDAASAVERAITRDRVDFLLGGVRTEAVQAIQDVISEHKRLFLGVGAAHPILTQRVADNYEKYKYYFRVSPLCATHLGTLIFMQLRDVAAVVRRELGVARPRVAIVAERAAWVEPIVAAAERVLPGMGMDVAGIWRPSATASDTTAELAAIRAAGANIIIQVFIGPVGTVFVRQWAEMRVPAALAGINTDVQGGRFWQATGGTANYAATMATLGRIPLSPHTIPFFDNFMRRHNNEVPLFTASGAHNALNVLRGAIERAGTISVNEVIEEMKKTDFQGLSGQLVFNERHDLKFGPGYVMSVGIQWQNGKVETFWPIGYGGTVPYRLPPWMRPSR
ncbi:MAG: Leucine-, isoleucine-, valine-, threonine-, and alanine-binding protein [Syntrophomonadaceae bacterium]|nr:Leucine-, isoleucine-, valine-, threonine-, and alanine-binding protein [Bacillota bacterium]